MKFYLFLFAFFSLHKRNAFHIIKSKERKKKIVVINITQLRETGKFREKRKKQFIPYLNRKMLNQSHSHQFINILWQFFGNENSLDKTIAMMIREINHKIFCWGIRTLCSLFNIIGVCIMLALSRYCCTWFNSNFNCTYWFFYTKKNSDIFAEKTIEIVIGKMS